MPTYHGSCHCGDVRYDVTLDLGEVVECNCSICSRT
ncbi:MAG TPA: GFA family protein, partial [Myxococcota bacterium]|nr:GFA family protein [Myxococcota bacterium]